MLLCCATYLLRVNILDMKDDLRHLNKDITRSLEHSFEEIRQGIYMQALLAEVNGAKIIKDGRSKKQFRSIYILDSANDKIIDSFEYISAHKLENFEMAFLSKLTSQDFAVSKFKFNQGEDPYFYVAYRISDQYYMVAEIETGYFFKKLKDELGYKFDSAYITDGKELISGTYPKKIMSASTIKRELVKGEDLKPEVKIDYINATGYFVSYDARYGLYVVSFFSDCPDLISAILMSLLILASALTFIIILLRNVNMLNNQLVNPLLSIENFLQEPSDKDFQAQSDIQEIIGIKKGAYSLYKQMQKISDMLRDNEERFGYIFERSPINIIVYDAYSGQIVEASKAAQRLYGYSHEEMLGLNILDMSDFSMREVLFSRQNALEKGSSYTIKQVSKSGRSIDAKINISEINLSDGNRFKFLIIKDISKKLKKRKNIEIIEQYSYLMSGVVMVALKDEPFKITNSTKSINDIFGINYDSLLENGFNILDLVVDQDKNAFTSEINMNKRLFASGASNKDSLRLMVRLHTKTGKILPYRIFVKFVRDVLGNFKEIVYSASDYSEQQSLIEKRELDAKISRNIIWATGVVSFEWDNKTDTLRPSDNYAQMVGYDSLKELGVLTYDRLKSMLLVDKSCADFDEFFSRYRIDADTYGGDIPIYRRDGSKVWVRLRAKVVQKDSDGVVSKISGILSDITNERDNLFYKGMLASIFSFSDLNIAILDLDGNIIDVNDAFISTLGYSYNELIGNNISLINSGLHNVEFYNDLWEQLKSDGVWRAKIWNRAKNGEDVLQSALIAIISDDDGVAKFILATYASINSGGISKDYLEHIAYHDPLTKLPNRFLFTQTLETTIAELDDKTNIAVIYFDLDGFKSINDTYGHRIGDKFLVYLSNRFDMLFDDREFVARFGADEFGAIITYSNVGEIDELAQTMLRIASTKADIDGASISLSASIGVSIYDKQYSASDMLEQADWAMYQAKLAGKNRYYIFDAKRDRHFKRQYDDSIRLFKALESGEIFLQYQPQVDLSEGRIVSFEALVRWRSDDGVIYLEEFLPYLKNQNVLDDISIFCIKEALHAQYAYSNKYESTKVSVNITLSQLCKDDFFDKFKALVNTNSHLRPNMLILELTELGDGRYLDVAESYMKNYAQLGVSFVLDDFTSKDSSLEALWTLPFVEAKLSKSYCKNLLKNPNFLRSIKIIRKLWQTFGVMIVPKGIEDMATVRILSSLGFERFQGFAIQEAMFLDEMMKYKFDGCSEVDMSYLMDDHQFEMLCDNVHLRSVAKKMQSIALARADKQNIAMELKSIKFFHKESSMLLQALQDDDETQAVAVVNFVIKQCNEYINNVGTDRLKEINE